MSKRARSKRNTAEPTANGAAPVRQESDGGPTLGVGEDTPPAPATPVVARPSSAPSGGAVPAIGVGVIDDHAAAVLLPACFDATTVGAVYAALGQALTRPGDLVVDGRQVTSVDTAGGQLLAAAALTGRHLHLQASLPLRDFLDATALAVVLS